MKVLHVITALGVGGAENMLLKLLGASRLSGVDQRVIALLPDGALAGPMRATGAGVEKLDLLGGVPVIEGTLRLAAHARAAAPDIIQGWLYHGNLGATVARAVQPHRVPLIWGVRQSLPSLDGENVWARTAIWLGKWLSRSPDRILFNSQTSLAQHRAFGFHSARMQYLPNGFDTARFRPDAQMRASRRLEWGVSDRHVVFGLVARYHPAKDHQTFLRAARKVAEMHPCAFFVLCGAGTDHDNQLLSEQIAALGLLDRVRCLGVSSQVAEIMTGLDVLVSSSSHVEAFSNSIGEAMSSAVPCIVTDIGDSARVVDDTGRIVPPCDPARLAQAMITMIDVGRQGRLELGQRARNRIESAFSLDAVAAHYGALWQTLAAAV